MVKFFTSSIGKKYIMAVTGVFLVLFTLGHMVGNLQIFLGVEKLNTYAHMLQTLGPALWVIRIILLSVFLLHVVTGVSLYLDNKKARPIEYINNSTIKATLPSRTMIISGALLFVFIVYHILHFTLHIADPSLANLTTSSGGFDVYRMVMLGFSNIYAAAAYYLAMIFLAMHLYHGASSLLQSLGLNHPKYNKLISLLGPVLAVIIFIGNSSIPSAILMKWIK